MPREAEWTRPLQAWQRKLFGVAIYLAIVMMILGTAGILVETDQSKSGWLATSAFGRIWTGLGNLNLILIPLTVVGGMLGLLLSLHNLQQDSIALAKVGGGTSSPGIAKKTAPKRRAKKVD